ncbi:MAG: AAA family ATPase [Flavobacterium sp.]
MKIKLKNFRVFKELTTFEIRPITLLVGPNNSGKSSFTKSLLLLKEGYKKLDFKKGEHHLGSLEKTVNWDSDEKEIVMQFSHGIPWLSDNFLLEIIYESDGKVNSVRLFNSEVELFKISEPKIIGNEIQSFGIEYGVKIDINYILNLLFEKKILVTEDSASNKKIQLHQIENLDITINIDNYGDFEPTFQKNEIVNSVFFNEINKSNNIPLFFFFECNSGFFKTDTKQMIKFDDFSGEFIGEILEEMLRIQEESFVKISLDEDSYDYNPINLIKEYLNGFSLKKIEPEIKRKLNDFFKVNNIYIDGKDLIIVRTNLGKLVFSEDQENIFDFSFDNGLFKKMALAFDQIDFLSKRTNFISSKRNNQERIITEKSNVDAFDIALKFQKNNKDAEKLDFLKEMLRILGIDGEVVVENLEDMAVSIYIIRNNQKINIADLGFGFAQLIPIVLEIYNQGWAGYLIMEEPESNLHPALQSKLADLFVFIHKTMPNLHLIIETHSEYMIRKFQFLSAKKEVDINDEIIYYFDYDYKTNQSTVKPIEITNDGNLTDNFGPGFLDETAKLQFELMRLNREQNN